MKPIWILLKKSRKRAVKRACVCVCVHSAPDKPRIDSIATGDSSALVHFETSEHRPPINPGTEFYVESALESDAGTALLHVIRAVFKVGSLRVQPPPEMLRRNFFGNVKNTADWHSVFSLL